MRVKSALLWHRYSEDRRERGVKGEVPVRQNFGVRIAVHGRHGSDIVCGHGCVSGGGVKVTPKNRNRTGIPDVLVNQCGKGRSRAM